MGDQATAEQVDGSARFCNRPDLPIHPDRVVAQTAPADATPLGAGLLTTGRTCAANTFPLGKSPTGVREPDGRQLLAGSGAPEAASRLLNGKPRRASASPPTVASAAAQPGPGLATR